MSVVEESLGLAPSSRIRGRCTPPGSKSLAQRALVAAALARGDTRIGGLSQGEDVEAARALAEALGAHARASSGAHVELAGARASERPALRAAGALAVGESGTLARLATAAVALAGAPGEHWVLHARGSLLFRRSLALFDCLRAAGVEIVRQNLPGTWPVELVSIVPPAELWLDAPASSQEVSGVLLGLAAHPDERVLRVRGPIPSEPYLRLTNRVLATFGASVREDALRAGPEAHERRFVVQGPLEAPAEPFAVEPDASSAAVALAAACLSEGALCVPGLDPASPQGDVRVVAHLAALGCEAGSGPEGLEARGFPTRGATLALEGEPDLAPVLAAVAAGAALRHGATSTLTGLGTLPGKESDRLGGLAAALAAVGCAVEAGADTLSIGPGGSSAPELELDPRGDHRMAFCFALLGLLVPGVRVRDPGCVAKSWPSFWEDLEALGAVLERRSAPRRGSAPHA